MDAQQHQSPKQQLVQGLRNLFPDKTSAWRAQAALAVGQLQEDVAAGLVSVDAEDRRATIEAAVAAAAAAAPPAAAAAAAAVPAAAAVADVEVATELVHVEVQGDGVPFSMDCPLFQRKLHVAAIEKTLAADKLMLVGINDCFPVTDDKGYTVQTFSGGSTVTVAAKLRPEDTYKDDDLKEKRKQRWTSVMMAFLTMLGTAVMTRLMMMVPLPRHN